ncbi:CD164 sialomucin-like 2 protein isoform X3 [Tachysurus fulvidraco]|uniref:CD164 sialomucin-like 2 protein isoform X3 n=1 Tax=Tachysurus fulvidraco TaxID=1234273 RepID=UPI000F5127C7|nr:CD164 sialomucin-like 2 protein isoform X3 [Tachysurus fulvidraco]
MISLYCEYSVVIRMRCVTVVLCSTVLLMQLMMTSSQAADDSAIGDCSQLDSCDRCTSRDDALNQTRCIWRSCDNDNDTKCISDTEDSGDCAVYNDTSTCPISGSFDDSGSDDSSSGSAPEFSQASFDLSSFIGGIILVLSLQAGAFFALRFLKTKDSSYETIDQPQ